MVVVRVVVCGLLRRLSLLQRRLCCLWLVAMEVKILEPILADLYLVFIQILAVVGVDV
jgi:hypothetical protein